MLGWFIASVDWAVGFNHIRGMMNSVLDGIERDFVCAGGSFVRNSDTFVQASIADVSSLPTKNDICTMSVIFYSFWTHCQTCN